MAQGLRMRSMQAQAEIHKHAMGAPRVLVEAADRVSWRITDADGAPANVEKLTKESRAKTQWPIQAARATCIVVQTSNVAARRRHFRRHNQAAGLTRVKSAACVSKHSRPRAFT